MKKVLLITLQDNNNIGNRLQNYALQTAIEQRGNEVVNLDNGYTTIPSHKEFRKNKIKKWLGKLGSKKYARKYQKFFNSQLRRQANERFTSENITNIRRVTYAGVFEQKWDSYDLAITGSDQVWHNWHKDPKELPYYYLEFMPEEKRVSYAASFGFDEFPDEDRAEHVKGQKGMHAISCREKSGCKLVKEATGKNSVHVLDPTLLLKADDWRKAEADVSAVVKPGEKYAFLYFLGNITAEYQKYIDEIVSKQGLRIINFLDMKDEKIAKCGVGEFISLIDHAEYVLTDSFHCTVFSILFDKQFTVFKRKQDGFEKMYSRIEELLQSTDHMTNSYNKIIPDPQIESFETLYNISCEYLEQILR
jgi:hypothetical protein